MRRASPSRGQVAAVGLAVLGLAPVASARYVQREIQDVPVERLIANLERAIEAKPDDAALRQHLARTLAMAWAKRLADTSEVEAVEGGAGSLEPWFGYGETRAVPFASESAEAGASGALLERAIVEYEHAVALDPDDVRARLGLAWCRDQAGDRPAARRGYREVLEAAWESEAGSRGTLGTYVSSEAIGYLLPLLDVQSDAEEIAELTEKRKTLESRPRAITPIAIPLDDHLAPSDLVVSAPGVRFDLDGSGRVLAWQWISPRAAWLVWDPKQQAQIGSGLQLLGSRSFLLFPEDGYAALALLDDDGDGWLRGPELRGLALWTDGNGDGRSEAHEVRPLAAFGIMGLSCAGRPHPQGFPFAPGGVELSDGRRRDSFDLVLSTTAERTEVW